MKSPQIDPQQALLFRYFNEIGIINQLASTRFEQRLPDGLTLPQFSVLNRFVRLGGTATPAQLASAFQVTRGAMTNTLARLESRGSIRIEPDPADGRRKLVTLTAAGRRLRNRAIAAIAPDLARVAAALEPQLLEAQLPALVAVREWLDEHRL